ncbi:hypothetical protein [Desulfosediminicola flagellatus]|uniref:hypothetical protein n=1 Tax=Desulfosediminicola flagellatus TaxID=2569541 RepID=UPI0010AD3072|nr:hypothetical protein [Desulfosediminicola flagellatus]
MIEETGGLSSSILTEQLLRQSGTNQTSERQSERPQETSQEQTPPPSDTVTISAEAATLATAAQAVSETSEVNENPAEEQQELQPSADEQSSDRQRPGTIDIRV